MPLQNPSNAGHKSTHPVHKKPVTLTGITKTQVTSSRSTNSPNVAPSAAKMGNGASATQIMVDGEMLDLTQIKTLIPELRKKLKLRDIKIQQYEHELSENRHVLEERTAEVARFKEEVHKLKSVLHLKVHKDGKPDLLATIQENSKMAGQENRNKKQGVSGESPMSHGSAIDLQHFDKDFR